MDTRGAGMALRDPSGARGRKCTEGGGERWTPPERENAQRGGGGGGAEMHRGGGGEAKKCTATELCKTLPPPYCALPKGGGVISLTCSCLRRMADFAEPCQARSGMHYSLNRG